MRELNRFWAWDTSDTGDGVLQFNGPIAEESWWGDEITPAAFKAELAKYAGRPITVWINSPGGDVFAASQIYTALMEHTGDVTVKIDGYAMSAASVVAMAGTRVLMAPTAIMMIHNPWGRAVGDADEMEHMAEVLNEVKESIINAYELKSGLPRREIAKMMDAETFMNPRKALEKGFIDEILYSEEVPAEPAASYAYSRMAVFNNFRDKIIKPDPVKVRADPRGDTVALKVELFDQYLQLRRRV